MSSCFVNLPSCFGHLIQQANPLEHGCNRQFQTLVESRRVLLTHVKYVLKRTIYFVSHSEQQVIQHVEELNDDCTSTHVRIPSVLHDLGRFVVKRDDGWAFDALPRRHGVLVWMLGHWKDSEVDTMIHNAFLEGRHAKISSEAGWRRHVTRALHHLNLHPFPEEALKREEHEVEPPEVCFWTVPGRNVVVLQLLGPMAQRTSGSDLLVSVATLFFDERVHPIPGGVVLHRRVG
mmetsp:Transcript_15022/g.41356  ORF Transcript_15022/g.41356 Transcript_15022/m.41356 type:complete len:233 (-) Transcript_15022:395-1093(-)